MWKKHFSKFSKELWKIEDIWKQINKKCNEKVIKARTLVAVHTHTHTHGVYLQTKKYPLKFVM